MTTEIVVVLGIALAAIGLFATERLRMDAVALLVLGSLALSGLVDAGQALGGFSNPATVTVAAMFVLAAGLQNSGALSGIGSLLGRAKSPLQFLAILFAVLAVIAPFVNNTAVVAVFMPIVMTATASVGMSASKALIPLSYVSQMAGVCTLVGTSTNLLVNAMAKDLGHPGFGMFEFTPLGLICMGAGCLYLLTLGRWLLPDTRGAELVEHYQLGKYITELRVMPDSSLIGTSVGEAKLGETFGVFVLELLRGDEKVWSPRAQTLQEGDVLLARGDWSQLDELRQKAGLEVDPQFRLGRRAFEEAEQVLTEVMVAPRSRVVGSTLATLAPRWQHDATVLGIHRRGQVLRDTLRDVRLRVGDILLMITPEAEMAALRKDKNVIVLSERDAQRPRGWRAPFALATMVLVIGTSALGWAPIAVTSLMGAVAMTLAGCLDADDVYDAIDWRIIILMAGLLPLGVAMSETGAAAFLVENTLGLVREFGPLVVLAVLYLMALLLTEFMSNAAAAVLLTPIGLSTARMMDVDATPFLIAVTFAASTSFATPVGYQTNTMVYGAGGYRFIDFVKAGLPLNLIFWVLGVIFIPVFWPF
ncbi:SLC13 family permease [Thauera linaloolentis]|uniref:Sodium (Na+) symporter n=1 Tax=Thauera linaloolentis (strain DSM 12138 / JCM 21573 / CCUG 41526 / CIP 105981 / IAM 15112 / NBRC 102519 / 47Lol) TaxID=1123367 RepID=N6Z4G0_THAL4|nr:SLC13 family permease [Thauera linaloolentis]ENO89323.1 sodium (Na+) symporter [Thauera linaloolentis 47Lol = DSM 12138]MCM8565028.1 SLC13 family permease [Thauera linaloolentis]